ncbi:hypothetical protein MML48_7g00012182 [Holotrichia oblita]|uniref:Uncharacterized protein n=1 Tax=Holotrichia oblita TaxID=644536 RepID=A0ACB9SW78_HOLOL|nr:hypothetical protein MML48_7g00012182 [Holotrichia oblita]
MKASTILLFCAASSVVALPPQQSRIIKAVPLQELIGNRIIGGSPASEAQIPYQVGIIISDSLSLPWHCSGALISAEWVVTGAMCIFGYSGNILNITMGGLTFMDPDEPGIVQDTTNTFIIHPRFNWRNFNFDIGLARLSSPVEFNDRIQPIRLPESGSFIEPGRPLIVSGWGRTTDAEPDISRYLNYVKVESISNADCTTVFGNIVVIPSTICTRGETNEGICNHDGGGPLVSYDYDDDIEGSYNVTATLQGVASFISGAGCEAGHPSGFLRITEVRDWIRENTGV